MSCFALAFVSLNITCKYRISNWNPWKYSSNLITFSILSRTIYHLLHYRLTTKTIKLSPGPTYINTCATVWIKAEDEDGVNKKEIETQTGEESVIEDFGSLDTLTTGSNFVPTTTENAPTETTTTVTTMTTHTATSSSSSAGQVTTTVEPAVDNVHTYPYLSHYSFWLELDPTFTLKLFYSYKNLRPITFIINYSFTQAAVDATTTDKDMPEENGDYYEYFDPEAEDKGAKPSSTPAAAPTFSSTTGLNIFRTDAVVPTTTEYVEPEVINTPPVIKSRLPKQPLTAGKPFGWAQNEGWWVKFRSEGGITTVAKFGILLGNAI